MAQPDEHTLTNSTERPDPLAQLRVETRRGQILAAAADAFAAAGFHRTKMRDVAARAGLAEGTIYNYFGGKDDLLLALLDVVNETDERPAAFADAAEESVEAFVRRYVAHRLEAVEPHLGVLRAILSELLVDPDLRARYYGDTVAPTLKLAEDYLAEKADEGEIAPQDPGLLARALAAQVLGLALLRMLGDARLEAEWGTLQELLPELLLTGLRPGRDP